MSVFETVADLVQRIHAGYLFDDGPGIEGWAGAVGLPWFAWVDSRVGEGYIILSEDISADLLAVDGWETHPELHRLVLTDWRGDQLVHLALSAWVLDDSALEAVRAADVDPGYARAAHRAGITDARQLVEAWRGGIPVEFLSAMGGAA